MSKDGNLFMHADCEFHGIYPKRELQKNKRLYINVLAVIRSGVSKKNAIIIRGLQCHHPQSVKSSLPPNLQS